MDIIVKKIFEISVNGIYSNQIIKQLNIWIMANLEKYNKIFCETFELKEEQLAGLQYQGVELWDSVGHMSLIAALEDEFDIMFESDDIIDFSSYEKGKEILKSKYDVEI